MLPLAYAVLWDNRQMIHRATPFDVSTNDVGEGRPKDRLMWRVTVRGGVPGRPAVASSSQAQSAAKL